NGARRSGGAGLGIGFAPPLPFARSRVRPDDDRCYTARSNGFPNWLDQELYQKALRIIETAHGIGKATEDDVSFRQGCVREITQAFDRQTTALTLNAAGYAWRRLQCGDYFGERDNSCSAPA